MMAPYICVPLTSNPEHFRELEDFTIDREKEFSSDDKVIGLEAYLKRCAWQDDIHHDVRIYIIKDRRTEEIAAYFGLKAGMVADFGDGLPSDAEKQAVMDEFGAKLLPSVIPGIEISHFAVNDNYRRNAGSGGKPLRGLGEYFYPALIYPIIEDVAEKIGVGIIYLYAAGDDRLVSYYEKVFGFLTLEEEDCFIPLQPGYDQGCRFMYRML